MIERRVIIRDPLEFPRWQALKPVVRRRIERLEEQVIASRRVVREAAHTSDFVMSANWCEQAAQLMHPHSEWWISRRRPGALRDLRDSYEERIAYEVVRMPLLEAITNPSTEIFIDTMRSVCARMTGVDSVDYRRSSIGLATDLDGSRVEFGPWEQVHDRISQLHVAIRTTTLPPTMTALAAMATLLNIHPFLDGNGRSARVLFNATYQFITSDAGSYLPLCSILEASKGGFEIRLRDAETNGNWVPLIDYFYAVYGVVLDVGERLVITMQNQD